jgi:hypothetical protein
VESKRFREGVFEQSDVAFTKKEAKEVIEVRNSPVQKGFGFGQGDWRVVTYVRQDEL